VVKVKNQADVVKISKNKAGSEVLEETIYGVIHDLWTLMREMISYTL